MNGQHSHILFFTADVPWDPSIIDGEFNPQNAQHITLIRHGNFYENGEFPQIEVSSCLTSLTIPHPIRDQFVQASVTVPTP